MCPCLQDVVWDPAGRGEPAGDSILQVDNARLYRKVAELERRLARFEPPSPMAGATPAAAGAAGAVGLGHLHLGRLQEAAAVKEWGGDEEERTSLLTIDIPEEAGQRSDKPANVQI